MNQASNNRVVKIIALMATDHYDMVRTTAEKKRWRTIKTQKKAGREFKGAHKDQNLPQGGYAYRHKHIEPTQYIQPEIWVIDYNYVGTDLVICNLVSFTISLATYKMMSMCYSQYNTL